jgi:hypothetical protein
MTPSLGPNSPFLSPKPLGNHDDAPIALSESEIIDQIGAMVRGESPTEKTDDVLLLTDIVDTTVNTDLQQQVAAMALGSSVNDAQPSTQNTSSKKTPYRGLKNKDTAALRAKYMNQTTKDVAEKRTTTESTTAIKLKTHKQTEDFGTKMAHSQNPSNQANSMIDPNNLDPALKAYMDQWLQDNMNGLVKDLAHQRLDDIFRKLTDDKKN